MKGFGCVYDPEGDALLGNTFVNDGYFGNPSQLGLRADRAQRRDPEQLLLGQRRARRQRAGQPGAAQPTCGGRSPATNPDDTLLGQVLCDTGFGSCPAGATYPKATGVVMHPPAHRPSDHAQPVPRRAGQRLVPRLIDPVGVRSGTDCGGSGVPCAVCS